MNERAKARFIGICAARSGAVILSIVYFRLTLDAILARTGSLTLAFLDALGWACVIVSALLV